MDWRIKYCHHSVFFFLIHNLLWSIVYCSFAFTDAGGFLAQHAEEKAWTYSDADFSRRSHWDQESGTPLYSSICSPRTCWIPNWGTEKLQAKCRCETHTGSYLSFHCRQRNVYQYTIKVNVNSKISTFMPWHNTIYWKIYKQQIMNFMFSIPKC